MKVSVTLATTAVSTGTTATTPETTTAVSTGTTATTPETTTAVSTGTTAQEIVLINGYAYKISNETNFYIYKDSSNFQKGSYEFVNIGRGCWYNKEIEKRLIAFDITIGDESKIIIVNSDSFNWNEFFDLPFTPHGTFDGSMWSGTIQNKVGENQTMKVAFMYLETEYKYLNSKYKQGETEVISSVQEFLKLFNKFDEWLKNEGIRQINPFF